MHATVRPWPTHAFPWSRVWLHSTWIDQRDSKTTFYDLRKVLIFRKRRQKWNSLLSSSSWQWWKPDESTTVIRQIGMKMRDNPVLRWESIRMASIIFGRWINQLINQSTNFCRLSSTQSIKLCQLSPVSGLRRSLETAQFFFTTWKSLVSFSFLDNWTWF